MQHRARETSRDGELVSDYMHVRLWRYHADVITYLVQFFISAGSVDEIMRDGCDLSRSLQLCEGI